MTFYLKMYTPNNFLERLSRQHTHGGELSPHSRLLLHRHQLLRHEVLLLQQVAEGVPELAHRKASGGNGLHWRRAGDDTSVKVGLTLKE